MTIMYLILHMHTSSISNVYVQMDGTYYTSPPTIRFVGGDPDDSAEAVAIIDSATGTVTSVTITNQGSGYETQPTAHLMVVVQSIVIMQSVIQLNKFFLVA